jgi:hypothetical protein
MQVQEYIHYFWTFKDFVFISEKPKLKFKNNLLHCDGGKSVEYNDGWGWWNLNGISVSQEIAETPAEKLNPELILNEQNADIQREILKKIGAERALKKLNAKCLDKWTDPKTGKYYELLNLKANSIDRKYLYYEHASLPGYFYAKPIPPEINKAMHGRAWILGIIERNEILSIDANKEIEIEACLPSQLS